MKLNRICYLLLIIAAGTRGQTQLSDVEKFNHAEENVDTATDVWKYIFIAANINT